MMRALVSALVFALAAAPAAAQPRPPAMALPPPPISGDMSDADLARALDAWFAQLQRDGVFNGVALLARDGREIFSGAYGVIDVASGAPLTIDTRFPVASIGKQFTHVAAAQMIAEGQWTRETTVGAVLSDFPAVSTRDATVAQLLTHRGGVANFHGPAFRDAAKDRFTSNHAYFGFVAPMAPAFAPGEREEYCNGCYVVLGEMIERASGRPYEQVIAERVFARAGMRSAGFFRYDQAPPNTARFIGRPRGPGGALEDVSRWHGVAGSAAGNAYTTARDLLAFDTALREHRLLDPALTAEVLRGQPEPGRRATTRIGFAGGGPGVNALLMGNGRWTLVVLANFEPPIAEAVGQTVFPLLAGGRAE